MLSLVSSFGKWSGGVPVALALLHLTVRSNAVSVTLACFVKPDTSEQLPRTLPPRDLVAVSGSNIWKTTLTSYTTVYARGIISSFLASQDTSRLTDHHSYVIIVTNGDD